MKAERNIITMDEYGKIIIPNISNIWMSINELIDLFDITYPTLTNIKPYTKSVFSKNTKCKGVSIILWNKHRCLCTPDDYCSILSIEYIGSIQGKRVCNEQTHNQAC